MDVSEEVRRASEGIPTHLPGPALANQSALVVRVRLASLVDESRRGKATSELQEFRYSLKVTYVKVKP